MTEVGGVANGPAPSGTVTFLFTDIEGSTQRWDRHRSAMQEAVRCHDALMNAAIIANGGLVFKTIGDAFCAAFATPESAAAAALDAQRALGAADFSAIDGCRVRMAINTGTADERTGDYFGPTVNRVARLLNLGHGGQILLSGIAADLVRENPPLEATLVDLGAYLLKDLERQEQVYQLVAPGLQRDFPELRVPKSLQTPWLVPDAMRTHYFTGRERLLEKLRAQLVERHRAGLSGLGGVGKTQLAIEYATRHRTEYSGGVFWIDAETTSGITSGFVDIAKKLRLPAAESNRHDEAVRALLTRLNGTDNWLLILDNVGDRQAVRPFIPEGGGGDLLITSRESVFPELGIPRAIEVQDLDGEEAVRFLLTRTGREDVEPSERSAAAEIAAELGNLPLALEQAAAYVAETNAAFATYLSALRKRRVKLLEKAADLVSHETVEVTWAANFGAVEAMSPAAAEVLRISSLLAPDAIPFEVFLDGAQALGGSISEALAEPDDLAVPELLRPLARYSLIRSDAMARTFSIHRLVQEIAWTSLAESERTTYLQRAIVALDAAFPATQFETWARCERLVRHVEAIAARTVLYATPLEAAGRVLTRAAAYLLARGRYEGAQVLSERVLAMRERALGPDHRDVASSLNDLAVAYWYQGLYREAQTLNERALAIRERALGPDDQYVANSLNTLGIIHADQGHFELAQKLLERALKIVEKAAPSHWFVANVLSNLGGVHREQGHFREAQPLFERALAIRERAFGSDHPDIAPSLADLADILRYQGRFVEAKALAERALTIAEQTHGTDHPDVALRLIEMAKIDVDLGQYSDAEPLVRRARAIYEAALRPDHPAMAQILTSLAKLYVLQNRPLEAEPLLTQALSLRENALGRDHFYLAETLVVLASLRKLQGRAADAVEYYERALAIKSRSVDADNPELAAIQKAIEELRAAPSPPRDSAGEVVAET